MAGVDKLPRNAPWLPLFLSLRLPLSVYQELAGLGSAERVPHDGRQGSVLAVIGWVEAFAIPILAA